MSTITSGSHHKFSVGLVFMTSGALAWGAVLLVAGIIF